MADHTERRAEVVVIGGGVIGASVAFHLARRGVRDVVVLDRGRHPGEGSTGRATGGFRAQFATPVNVALSLLARAKLRRFKAEVGVDAGYQECGYLFAAGSDAQLEILRAAQRVQHAAGLTEAEELTAQQVLDRNPAVRGDDIVGGVFCPSDGFIRPLHMLGGYSDAASHLGATFVHGAEVRRLHKDRDRVTAVETSRGTVHCGAVVNAAGAWAAGVARLAGVHLPVTPVRRQVAATAYTDVLPADMPMTIFTDDGFHLRVRDGRVLLLWPGPALPHTEAEIRFDRAWLPEVVQRAHRRVPCLAPIPVDAEACAAGLYEVSPDGHAILGRAPGVDNLYLANGSSGHGVMHAPALGHLLAELIVEGRITTLDVHALRPERFAEDDACTVPDLF